MMLGSRGLGGGGNITAINTATVALEEEEVILLSSGAASIAAALGVAPPPSSSSSAFSGIDASTTTTTTVQARRVIQSLSPFADLTGDFYRTKVLCLLSLACDPSATAFNAAAPAPAPASSSASFGSTTTTTTNASSSSALAVFGDALLMNEGVDGLLWHKLWFGSAEPLCVALASTTAEALLHGTGNDNDNDDEEQAATRERRATALSNQLDLFAAGSIFGDNGFSRKVFDPTGTAAYFYASQLLLLGYPEQAVAHLAAHGAAANASSNGSNNANGSSTSNSGTQHLADAVHLALSLHYLGLLHSLPDEEAMRQYKTHTLPQLLLLAAASSSSSAAPRVAVDVTLEPVEDEQDDDEEDNEGEASLSTRQHGSSSSSSSSARLLYYCTYRYKRVPSASTSTGSGSSSGSSVSEWPDVVVAGGPGGGQEEGEGEEEDAGATSATVFAIDLVGLVTAFLNHCLPDNAFAAADYLTLATYETESSSSSSSPSAGTARTRQQELLAQLLAHSGAFTTLAGPLSIVNAAGGGARGLGSGAGSSESLSLEAQPLRGYLATHGIIPSSSSTSTSSSSRPEDSLARIILRAGEIAHRAEGNAADALSLYLRVPFYCDQQGEGEGVGQGEDIGGLKPALSILIQALSSSASDPWWSASSSVASGLIASAAKKRGASAGSGSAAQRELFKRVAAAVYTLPIPEDDQQLQQHQRALGPLLHLCNGYESLAKHDYQSALSSFDASQLLPMQLSSALSGSPASGSAAALSSSWARVFDPLPEALKQCYSTLLLAAAESLRGMSSALERRAAVIAGGSIGGAALDAGTRNALRSLKERCRCLHSSPPHPESMRRYVDGTVLAALQRVEAEMPLY